MLYPSFQLTRAEYKPYLTQEEVVAKNIIETEEQNLSQNQER